jgi:hypothetical protein
MILSLYESAAFYGAPLSVKPVRHHDLRLFVDLVLKEKESRLMNLLPLILAKQAEEKRDVTLAFNQWASQDPLFRNCWEFTQLALRQTVDQVWSDDNRHRWRQVCEETAKIAIEPQRALENIRRFLKQPA